MLAICRGMQLLNVAHGGSLVQHLPEVVGHDEHNPTPGVFSNHLVRIEPRCRLATLPRLGRAGRSDASPSGHRPPRPRASRPSDGPSDGTIEAIEEPSARPFVIGVQWHPEADDNPAVFEALVGAATRVLARRRERSTRSRPGSRRPTVVR